MRLLSFHLLAVVPLGLALIGWPALTQTSASPGSPAAQQDERVVKDFETRVARYLELRKKEAGSAPKPTASTTKLADSREQMAAAIRSVRAGARQGDIFAPEIAQYFRRQLAATLKGQDGSKIRASLRHAEPLREFPLKVNEPYPQSAPLQSTPPSLLLNLPSLPKELQYRIVGNDLVLLDTAPNIVVDLIPNVVPQS